MEVSSTYKKDLRIGKVVTATQGQYNLIMKLRRVHKDGDVYDAIFARTFTGDLLGNVSLDIGTQKVNLGNLFFMANLDRSDELIKILCAKIEVTDRDVDREKVKSLYLFALEMLKK